MKIKKTINLFHILVFWRALWAAESSRRGFNGLQKNLRHLCYFYTILHSIRAQFYVHTCFCTFYYSYAENQRFLLIFGYWATLWMAGSSRTYSSWLTKKFDKSQTTLLPSYIILDPYFNQKYAKKNLDSQIFA